MKSITFLVAPLCLGLWTSCSSNYPSSNKLLEMSTVEKWACLKRGMAKDKVFRLIGKPQSSRASEIQTIYTFDCFLCTANFDTLNKLTAWHGPENK